MLTMVSHNFNIKYSVQMLNMDYIEYICEKAIFYEFFKIQRQKQHHFD